MSKLAQLQLSNQWLATMIAEWNDEPRVPSTVVVGKPATVRKAVAKPVVQAAGKYVGNASKTHCIIERKGRIVRFVGSMTECQQKLMAKHNPKYAMVLYRA